MLLLSAAHIIFQYHLLQFSWCIFSHHSEIHMLKLQLHKHQQWFNLTKCLIVVSLFSFPPWGEYMFYVWYWFFFWLQFFCYVPKLHIFVFGLLPLDGSARIFPNSNPGDLLGFKPTSVSIVALDWDLLKDVLLTELPRRDFSGYSYFLLFEQLLILHLWSRWWWLKIHGLNFCQLWCW